MGPRMRSQRRKQAAAARARQQVRDWKVAEIVLAIRSLTAGLARVCSRWIYAEPSHLLPVAVAGEAAKKARRKLAKVAALASASEPSPESVQGSEAVGVVINEQILQGHEEEEEEDSEPEDALELGKSPGLEECM